jgi:hypothetical protein
VTSLEDLITRLVREAPALDPDVVSELRDQLWARGSPLALSIARIVELVGEQLVDPAVALPALAEAIATLEASDDPTVLEAARFQIDTLQPVPDGARHFTIPDVSAERLKRK